jgi:predicted LPLAT superfamily acyltransferase
VLTSIWLYLTPLWILLGLLLILGILTLLGRVAGGKYLRPIVTRLMKLPLLGRGMKKASEAALERQNPDLANAIKKLERSGATRDPTKAQQAMSQLTAAERRAYLDAAGEQVDQMPQEMNRQMRRQMERARKRGRG